MTCKIFQSIQRSLGQRLYTLCGSWSRAGSGCSDYLLDFQVGFLMSNSTVGDAGFVRGLRSPSSVCLVGSFRVLRRKWSISSFFHARRVLHFCPNSCFMNPNRLAIKVVHLLALPLPHLLCHSVLRTVIDFFLRMFWSSASGGPSFSNAVLKAQLMTPLVDLDCPTFHGVVRSGVFSSSAPNISAVQLTIISQCLPSLMFG